MDSGVVSEAAATIGLDSNTEHTCTIDLAPPKTEGCAKSLNLLIPKTDGPKHIQPFQANIPQQTYNQPFQHQYQQPYQANYPYHQPYQSYQTYPPHEPSDQEQDETLTTKKKHYSWE
jgi:hypothetical protein